MLEELLRREKQLGIKPEPEIDVFMKATAISGILTALMVVTGAGKTTLMDVLAGRKTGGYVEGTIGISGYPKKQATFARINGYCEQNDIHSPHVTVYESLLFSAWLRLSSNKDFLADSEGDIDNDCGSGSGSESKSGNGNSSEIRSGNGSSSEEIESEIQIEMGEEGIDGSELYIKTTNDNMVIMSHFGVLSSFANRLCLIAAKKPQTFDMKLSKKLHQMGGKDNSVAQFNNVVDLCIVKTKDGNHVQGVDNSATRLNHLFDSHNTVTTLRNPTVAMHMLPVRSLVTFRAICRYCRNILYELSWYGLGYNKQSDMYFGVFIYLHKCDYELAEVRTLNDSINNWTCHETTSLYTYVPCDENVEDEQMGIFFNDSLH
ncbi:hypothetical protein VNO78_17806 [Psophocarpus tetragonolobus]|uniref:Uncharacterized protein n=1 Tax=Psophocarpus tetragonolobus TaxID=3891 RepID=A0AAN9SIQ2_PSOTE